MPERQSILIVDDEEAIRILLEEFLTDKYEVLIAEDGEKAWRLIQERNGDVDIILSDIHMPIMDGINLLLKVRAAYQDMCVIMMSGTSDVHKAIQAIRQGAYDYVSKPINQLEEIEIIIRRWLQHRTIEAKLVQYAELHKDIMQNLRVRTFLGLDVAGSRSMKIGENPLLIQYSFLAYHKFVEAIVLKNGGQIHSTAGDGVMSCFVLPQAAINAVRQIIAGLNEFNEEQNRLSKEFSIRAGIHTGNVVVQESGRVNEMYSEALDITGHIQKDAGINQVEISEATVEILPDSSQFIALNKEIGGLAIYLLNCESE